MQLHNSTYYLSCFIAWYSIHLALTAACSVLMSKIQGLMYILLLLFAIIIDLIILEA